MDIYIDLLIIIALMITFILWKVWYSISTKRALKKYKPENDKSRKGGVFNNGRIGIPESRIDDTVINLPGFEQPEGRELLPKTDISDAGKDSTGTREDSSNVRRRLFRRHQKK